MDIKTIQSRLVELGYSPGSIDGIMGSKTKAAIKAFQKDAGLVVDGIVGPKTVAAMVIARAPDTTPIVPKRLTTFVGTGKRLADADLPRIGSQIGVGEDELHAFLDVETAGGGFDSQNRPKMLFEPHIFYRNLSGSKRTQAISAGIAYASWKSGAYPRDSYPRLERAIAIDETAALKSASWGIGQILGENYVAAGYESPQAMVVDFVTNGEAAHLQAAVNFIKATHLDDELRSHNWAGFARGYNGSGYAKNKYDKKLAAAYAKWSKIKDTPWSRSA